MRTCISIIFPPALIKIFYVGRARNHLYLLLNRWYRAHAHREFKIKFLDSENVGKLSIIR